MILTTGQPFWLTEHGMVRYPRLEHDLTCDVAVVGGGITGAFLGYYLTKAGLKTAVLEGRYLGGGSTSASTAMCQYELDVDLIDLRNQLGIQRANDAYLANLYSVHALHRLCTQELPVDCHFQYCQSFYLASKQRDVNHLADEGDARRGIGIEARYLSEAELLERYQLLAPAALLSDDTAQVDPYLLTHTLLQTAQQSGLQVFERTPVQSCGVTNDGQGVTVQAGAHRVRAGHVVVCTGYEADNLVPRDLVNLHSTYVVLSQPGEATALPTGTAQIWETARPYLYTRTTPDGRIMVGGRDEAIKAATFQNTVLEHKVEKLEKQFQELFDCATPFTRDFVWGGVYGETSDGLPYIGPHKDFPRTYFALGYGGNGTTYSLLAAEIIRDALTGRQHRHAATFAFDRVGGAPA
ncbi:FAD-binding oxidoreductase [Hymenobacter busanensis]|uniref:FAD-binding oxidoreductase n=1 Tax=Hymenobacter busanensis TaxID=2607656 RepID=A0A7L5A238_9BACT|nr:FAD-dependent oxidoreductase [Hymenobacter busanensis]KAA9338407.1 FAD-binding oxidoreductase [Hymenobacter busanensis]QHJ09166.1 FAD-dependent oxidoreductase [Hymenobacter busanensis]